MPFAYWTILIAALLPLVLAAYAKSSSRNNNAPRDAAGNLSGAKRRAYAAHQNAYDNFPFFAAAVILALAYDAPLTTLNWLASAYIAARIAHAVCYIFDIATARSFVFLIGLVLNIAIFVLPALQ